MVEENLSPDNGGQLDWFICDILTPAPKDDLGSMEHPVFALSTKPEAKVRRYERNGIFVEVAPSVLGHATIFDKDILIYCTSQLVEALNRSREVKQTIRVTAYDLLVATNRETNGDSYQRLKLALDRLAGTRIKTNIRTGGKKIVDAFGLIDKYRIVEKSPVDQQMIAIEITLSDWLYSAIQGKETLTLHREYFQLRKALERRLYEIARKHCGKQVHWQASLQTLYEKSGSGGRRNEFRRMVKGVVEDNPLPGYSMSFDVENDMITFTNRNDNIIAQSKIKQLLLPEKKS